MRHYTISNIKSADIFSRLFRYADTRTFPLFSRVSRSALSIQCKFAVMNKLIRAQNSYSNDFTREAFVHIPKFVVNISLIIMFNPNIYLYSRAFFSVVAGGILHFYSGFFVNDLAGVNDYYGLRLGKKG